jgi:hypothetical protein
MSQTSPKPRSHAIAHARQGESGDWETHGLILNGKGGGLRSSECGVAAAAHNALQGTKARRIRSMSPAGAVGTRPECR